MRSVGGKHDGMGIRADKRNKYARVLTVRQAPSLKKNGGNFVVQETKKKLRAKYMLSQFSQ